MATQYELVSSVEMYEFVGPISILSVDPYTQFGNHAHTHIGTPLAIDDCSESVKNTYCEEIEILAFYLFHPCLNLKNERN